MRYVYDLVFSLDDMAALKKSIIFIFTKSRKVSISIFKK